MAAFESEARTRHTRRNEIGMRRAPRRITQAAACRTLHVVDLQAGVTGCSQLAEASGVR